MSAPRVQIPELFDDLAEPQNSLMTSSILVAIPPSMMTMCRRIVTILENTSAGQIPAVLTSQFTAVQMTAVGTGENASTKNEHRQRMSEDAVYDSCTHTYIHIFMDARRFALKCKKTWIPNSRRRSYLS